MFVLERSSNQDVLKHLVIVTKKQIYRHKY